MSFHNVKPWIFFFKPCVLSIALMLSDKLLSWAMKISLFLLPPPTHNHPLPVGIWRLPSRRHKSWPTSAIIIIPALAVVNDIVWARLEKAGLFT